MANWDRGHNGKLRRGHNGMWHIETWAQRHAGTGGLILQVVNRWEMACFDCFAQNSEPAGYISCWWSGELFPPLGAGMVLTVWYRTVLARLEEILCGWREVKLREVTNCWCTWRFGYSCHFIWSSLSHRSFICLFCPKGHSFDLSSLSQRPFIWFVFSVPQVIHLSFLFQRPFISFVFSVLRINHLSSLSHRSFICLLCPTGQSFHLSSLSHVPVIVFSFL